MSKGEFTNYFRHLILFTKFHLKCINGVIFSRIIHVLRNSYVLKLSILLFRNSETAVSKGLTKLNQRMEKVLFLDRTLYNSVRLNYRFRMNLNVTQMLVCFLLLVVRILLLAKDVFNSEITILSERIVYWWRRLSA